ncbi:MAG: M20/M25/M40 family metallo-hydrolase [Nitrospirota bacterium]|nr:M20/M25/M40 family metallo-hydrolase [Nitrospirota bacterium]
MLPFRAGLSVLAALIVLQACSHGKPPVDEDRLERMTATVSLLAGPSFHGRGVGTPELDKAGQYIADRFESAGLMPGGSRGWFQEWTDPDLKVRMRNVVGILPGRNQELAGQSVVIGAHYDHLGAGGPGAYKENQGRVHPGADDNGSGVAALLELVHVMTLDPTPERSIIFVAFTGEEAGRKGSRYFVANMAGHPPSKCVGMINLDTVGRLGKGRLIVLGEGSAREWPQIFQEAGKAAQIGVVGNSAALDASDQVSFHEAGVPAVQLFSGPHPDYHRPSDTAEKIDYTGLSAITTVARIAGHYLANLQGRLSATIALPASIAAAKTGDRKTTLGIVPDFTYQERGVRLGGVSPGGPAEAAGMRQGDIITQVNSRPVAGLKDIADELRSRNPGDQVRVFFLRQGKEMKADAVLKEK